MNDFMIALVKSLKEIIISLYITMIILFKKKS